MEHVEQNKPCAMIENPFLVLDRRMNRLEDLLLEIINSQKPEPQNDPATNYLTVSQAAERLQVAKSTLHRWASTGKLNRYRIGGRVYFLESELLETFKKFEA